MAFSGIYFSPSSLAKYGALNLHDVLNITSPQEPLDKGNSSSNCSGNDSGSGQTATSDKYTGSHYLGILDTNLTVLTNGQKNSFIITVTILCCISVMGNVSTLVVNFRRKIRPFFRACLISLAVSDLMNTMFLSTAYLSQFTEEYIQTWVSDGGSAEASYLLILCTHSVFALQRLGQVMCSLVPFATTAAILASSMTLVGIAVDRYYAVMKSVIGFWNPTVISCILCMLCIWLASMGIACPVFTIYNLQPVYILTEEKATDMSVAAAMATTRLAQGGQAVTTRISNITSAAAGGSTETPWVEDASQEDVAYTLIKHEKLVDMCISEQKDLALYYVIVFVIIFIPCIGAFFWFNIIIARKVWNRRHSIATAKRKRNFFGVKSKSKKVSLELKHPQYQHANSLSPPIPNYNCGSGHTSSTTLASGGGCTTTVTTSSSSATLAAVNCATYNSREARHLRMFTIILLMMAVFVFLRLPAWIFLLMRLYGSYNKPIHWILYFVFGMMNLASSMLNPLLYTFLTETIQYVLRVKAQVTALMCGSCSKCWYCYKSDKEQKVEKTRISFAATMENVEEPSLVQSGCEKFCGCCCGLLCATWQCYKPQTQVQRVHATAPVLASEFCAKDSSDKDEGVDFSEEMEEDMCDFDIYNQRIYTIYPESLVSSSFNSK